MDNISVISLSSTSTRSTFDNGCVLSVGTETERVPVSWDSGEKGKNNLLGFDVQDPTQKVTDWMCSCKCNGASNNTVNNLDKNTDDNSRVCIRYDFDKTTPSSRVHQTCYTRTRPLFSYMEEVKKIGLLSNYKKTNNGHHNGQNLHTNHTDDKDNNKKSDTPLSPESQKKELCNYLQLMKPSEKPKNNVLVENRRSNRVKNLNQTNEKKKNEEKSKDKEPQKDFTNFEVYEKAVESVLDYPTLKSFEELNMKIEKFRKFLNSRRVNKYLPLPPDEHYKTVVDFEDSIQETISEVEKMRKKRLNQCGKKVENRKKFKFNMKPKQRFKKDQFTFRRISSLRSKGYLRDISLNTLILRKSQLRKKAYSLMVRKSQLRKKALRRKMMMAAQEKPTEECITKKPQSGDNPGCEIISVHTNSDDENVDLKNFVDDMLELDKMSEEHRKSVIESRILTSSSIANLINKQTTQEEDVQRAYKIFSDLSNERRSSEGKENSQISTSPKALVTNLIISEHDYANFSKQSEEEDDDDDDDDDEDDDEESSDEEDLNPVPIPNLEVHPVNNDIEMKSLHRSLTFSNRRKSCTTNYGLHNWSSSSQMDNKKLNHSISITKKNGPVLGAFYQDHNLIIVQQNTVSFWTQSALGNILGAQNMWIPKGQSQRIQLNSAYIQKGTMEMVICNETSIAYVELWTKEHKSDIRQVPVADVFAIVYFWRHRQNGLDKKALQLENIKGFADDVQYVVLKCCPKIVVSWHSVQGHEKKTKIHLYHLAADFQTVANISEIQPVEHYVASLHNIEGCDNLVMGCGENKITLWNVEYGYIVATIELSNIKLPLSTLWVKCDRGFLFMIQECDDQELRLMAINGLNHSWKKLQSYNPLTGFDKLKGVCIENGILVAYYSQGILCWNAQTGEIIVEEVGSDCDYVPFGKYVIMIANEKVIVRHSLSHLVTTDDF